MSESDSLFALIRSMSKAEKRYFKLSVTPYAGEKNYLRLFDAIDQQRNYNESKIIRRFAKEKFIRHLPSEKNYLYRALVQSLVQFHRETTTEAQIRQLLAAAETLFTKKQYPQSQRMLQKAARFARTAECHSLLLQVLDREEQFVSRYEQVNTLENIITERRELLKIMTNVNDYLALLARVAAFIRKHSYVRSPEQKQALARLMKSPLLTGPEKALSLKALQSYYEIHCNYGTITGDFESVANHLRALVVRMDEHPAYIALHPGNYGYIILNLCIFCLHTGRVEEIDFYRKKLDVIRNGENWQNLHLRLNLEKSLLDLDLRVGALTCRFSEIISQLRNIREAVELREAIEPSLNALMRFNTAYALFVAGRHKEAIKWLQPIIDGQQIAFRGYDIYMKAVFLRLLLHYELHNVDVLEAHVRSLYRLLLRNDKLQRSERILIDFIRGLTNVHGQKQFHIAVKALYRDLLAAADDRYERNFVRNMGFMFAWLISKTKSIPLEAAAREVMSGIPTGTMKAR